MFLEYLEFVAIIHGISSLTHYPNQISQVTPKCFFWRNTCVFQYIFAVP